MEGAKALEKEWYKQTRSVCRFAAVNKTTGQFQVMVTRHILCQWSRQRVELRNHPSSLKVTLWLHLGH